MNDTVVAIVSAFFIIGIAVGIIARRGRSRSSAPTRRGDQGDHADPYDDDPYRPASRRRGSGWDDTASDGRPRWPGDADNRFPRQVGRPGRKATSRPGQGPGREVGNHYAGHGVVSWRF